MAVPIRDDLQHFHRSSGGCHALRREQIRERQRQNKQLCRCRAQIFQTLRVNDDTVSLRLSGQRRTQPVHAGHRDAALRYDHRNAAAISHTDLHHSRSLRQHDPCHCSFSDAAAELQLRAAGIPQPLAHQLYAQMTPAILRRCFFCIKADAVIRHNDLHA